MQRIEILKRVAQGARLYLSCTPWGAPVQGALLRDEHAPNGHRLIPGTQVSRLLQSGLLRRGLPNPSGESDLRLTESGYVAAYGRRAAAAMMSAATGTTGGPVFQPAPALQQEQLASAEMPRYSFAFQPIVDAARGAVVGYEAFVRGDRDESAAPILRAVPSGSIHEFDDACRATAMRVAARLGIRLRLHINCFVSELAQAQASLERTVATARTLGYDDGRLVLEIKADEMVERPEVYARRMMPLRALGLGVALSEIGAGLAGANLLAALRPDFVKLSRKTVRGVSTDARLQRFVSQMVQSCGDLDIGIIAECVETTEQYRCLRSAGIEQFQGNLFAPPAFEAAPPALLP